MEKKNKYIGFRIGYTDYMLTLQAAEQVGVSITDYLLSILLPQINKSTVKQPVETETTKEQTSNKSELKTGKEAVKNKVVSNNKNLEEIEEKIKKYNVKLNSI